MQHLILLHGAIGAKDQLQVLADELSNEFIVHNLGFIGHGGEPLPREAFSIELFAKQVLAYMENKQIAQASFFGYSMGGYVAMYIAKTSPGKVSKVCTLATKYHWDEATATREMKMLDPAKIKEKLPAFADQLAQRHQPTNWEELMQTTADLLVSLGKSNVLSTEDYPSIQVPVLILLGDRDKMVSLEETVNVYKQLPQGRLGILPATPHPIEQVNLQKLVFELRMFLN